MADREGNKGYRVPALEHGLAVLCAFTRQVPELGASDLSSSLDIPRASVFRILKTLESLGFLTRTDGGKRYRLAIGATRIALEYLGSQTVVDLGRPLIQDLCEHTNLRAHMAIRDGTSIVYVLRAVPVSSVTGTVSIGTRLPAHATVLGRVLLSGLGGPDIERLYDGVPIHNHRSQAPVKLSRLAGVACADRERGFVVSGSFYEDGISTVAAPIHDGSGEVVAAIGVNANSPRISAKLISMGIIDAVIDTAEKLATGLGYRGDAYALARSHAMTFATHYDEAAAID